VEAAAAAAAAAAVAVGKAAMEASEEVEAVTAGCLAEEEG
jgi:hypothetical protein